MSEGEVKKGRGPAGVSSYFQNLKALALRPGRFFSEMPEDIGFGRPFLFLVTSALIFALIHLIFLPQNPILMSLILFINAVGMPLITAAVGWAVAKPLMKLHLGFSKFFAVYAFAGGLVLLVSWVPSLTWFAEIGKWILIGIGLVQGCRLSRLQAVFLIGISICLMAAGFWSLNEVIQGLKGV